MMSYSTLGAITDACAKLRVSEAKGSVPFASGE